MALDKKWKETIYADGMEIGVLSNGDDNDYISLTDIARFKNDDPNDVIRNWMRGKDTLEFLGLWEQLNNSDIKPVEFEGFKIQGWLERFHHVPAKMD